MIGAGFTGSEIASVCRERELPVTVAERGPAPLMGAPGGVIGEVAAELQHQYGVDLRRGVMVTGLEGDGAGRLRRAHFSDLSDGDALDAEVAVVALGATRNAEWRRGGRGPLPASAVRLPVPVPGALGQRGRAGRGGGPQHDQPR